MPLSRLRQGAIGAAVPVLYLNAVNNQPPAEDLAVNSGFAYVASGQSSSSHCSSNVWTDLPYNALDRLDRERSLLGPGRESLMDLQIANDLAVVSEVRAWNSSLSGPLPDSVKANLERVVRAPVAQGSLLLAHFRIFCWRLVQMRGLKTLTDRLRRLDVSDVRSDRAAEAYDGMVELHKSVTQVESLFKELSYHESAIYRPAYKFLTERAESLEDTIEAWDLARSEEFEQLITARIREAEVEYAAHQRRTQRVS